MVAVSTFTWHGMFSFELFHYHISQQWKYEYVIYTPTTYILPTFTLDDTVFIEYEVDITSFISNWCYFRPGIYGFPFQKHAKDSFWAVRLQGLLFSFILGN